MLTYAKRSRKVNEDGGEGVKVWAICPGFRGTNFHNYRGIGSLEGEVQIVIDVAQCKSDKNRRRIVWRRAFMIGKTTRQVFETCKEPVKKTVPPQNVTSLAETTPHRPITCSEYLRTHPPQSIVADFWRIPCLSLCLLTINLPPFVPAYLQTFLRVS